MDDLLSEKEQIEEIRVWWSTYGTYVIVGIVLGALALVGWNYYQGQKRDAEFEASALYDELAGHVESGDLEDAQAVVDQLTSDYENTAYAAQAMLAVARLYMDKNRDQDAADVLRELMDSNAAAQFRDIARLRLAKVLLYQGKADEVVALLEDVAGEGAFAARFSDTLGDAYYALQDYPAAREAYSAALAEPSQAATVNQQFVQLKLTDLPPEAFAEMTEASTNGVEAEPAAEEAAEDAAGETVDGADEQPPLDDGGEAEENDG